MAEEKKVYLEPEYTKARVTDFAFKELVVLPREIDLNEWLASNSAWGGQWSSGRAQCLYVCVSGHTPHTCMWHKHICMCRAGAVTPWLCSEPPDELGPLLW